MDTWKKFFLDTNAWTGEVTSSRHWNSAISYLTSVTSMNFDEVKRHLLSSKRCECYDGDRFGLYSEYKGAETLAAFFEKNEMGSYL